MSNEYGIDSEVKDDELDKLGDCTLFLNKIKFYFSYIYIFKKGLKNLS